jgi:hypothetical protein
MGGGQRIGSNSVKPGEQTRIKCADFYSRPVSDTAELNTADFQQKCQMKREPENQW